MKTPQNLTIPLTAIINGKHVCLVCDARDMSSDVTLEDHLTGRKHQYNLYLFNNPENLSILRQKKLIKNTVCIIDCPKPFRFVCFACDSPTMNQKEAFDHIETKAHNKAVDNFQIKH